MRDAGLESNLGLERYAAERFLYRLGQSPHRDRFILKGATLFSIWGTKYRPTRDLDFTGYGSADVADVVAAIREICAVPDPVQELVFDASSVRAEPIRDGSEYEGLRMRFTARLGETRIPLQVDIGFGNAIVPGPTHVEYRTLLDDAAPDILAYPQESVVAEKLHALVVLGNRNSRYKDFYDLYVLASEFTFDLDVVVRAARATFERRATAVEAATPVALGGAFYRDARRGQEWRAYVARIPRATVPDDFEEVGGRVSGFLGQVWERASEAGAPAIAEWREGGPWRSR
jgi:predicted nucleotidyltransferase component of viral defense system